MRCILQVPYKGIRIKCGSIKNNDTEFKLLQFLLRKKKRNDSMGHTGATEKSSFSLVRCKNWALKGYYQRSFKTSVKGAINFS